MSATPISPSESNLLELYRQHRDEIDTLTDSTSLFILAFLDSIGSARASELARELGLSSGVLRDKVSPILHGKFMADDHGILSVTPLGRQLLTEVGIILPPPPPPPTKPTSTPPSGEIPGWLWSIIAFLGTGAVIVLSLLVVLIVANSKPGSSVPNNPGISAIATTETSAPPLIVTTTRTATPTSSPTYTPTPTPSNSLTPTPTPTGTDSPTLTPTWTPTPTLTGTPTSTPTSMPTWTPTPTLTSTPTSTPTFTPTSTRTYTPIIRTLSGRVLVGRQTVSAATVQLRSPQGSSSSTTANSSGYYAFGDLPADTYSLQAQSQFGQSQPINVALTTNSASADLTIVTPVDTRYAALGGSSGILGAATREVVIAPDGVGLFQDYQNGHIYWHPKTGAFFIRGSIFDKWAQFNWEKGILGYPTTDELTTPDKIGRYNHFQYGSIYWSPQTGAYEVHGAIRDEWASLGWERSVVGYPITDQLTTPDGIGRYNHFQYGSIYWNPQTGAYEVHGAIRDKWASLGWEKSILGYPTSDEMLKNKNCSYNTFQYGCLYLYWTAPPGTGVQYSPDPYNCPPKGPD